MDLIRFCISKPVTVSVGVLLILLFGLIAVSQIPIQLTPNIETTVISVTTRWEGATPQQVETEIVQEQEDKLKGIAGMTKMISESRQGEAQIRLEFTQDITKEQALREVSDKMREVPQYPDNVDEPVVEASNPADRDYIAWVIFNSADPNFDIRHLQDYLEDRIKPQFEQVPGISEINVIGGFEREVHIQIDPIAMASRGISPTQLVNALRAQNRDASAGTISEGKLDVRVRAVGRYERLDQIEDTLLSAPGEPVVRVRDIGKAVMKWKKPARVVRNKGRLVMAMNAQREVGSNVIQVMEGFKKVLERVNNDLLAAESRRLNLSTPITAEQVYDQTVYIYQALDLVTSNLWVGGALAAFVLLAFLRDVRSTAIISLAIPISVIGTFVAMVAMGRSINVISLAGLAFATGMVVDNAIVVLENIDRHRRLGENAMIAAYRAAKEVWGAVLASTLTTLCVFLPVVFMKEEAGQLFRDISLAICAAVSLSLLVAITVIPTAASRVLKGARTTAVKTTAGGTAIKYNPITRGLGSVISHLNAGWVRRLTVIAIMAIGSIVLSYLLMPPTSYLPAGNRNLVFGMLFAPPGYNLAQQEFIGSRIEEQIRPFWEAGSDPVKAQTLPPVPSFNRATGTMEMIQVPPLSNFFFVATPDMMFMGGISLDDQNVAPVESLLNNAFRGIPAVIGLARQLPLFRTSTTGSGDAIELEISGGDLDEVTNTASIIVGQLFKRFPVPGSVIPQPFNFNLPGIELLVERKPVRATDVGVTQADLNTAVQIFGEGAVIGDFLDASDVIDLKITSNTEVTNDASYLRQLPLSTASGTVPLDSVADIRRAPAPQQINRVNERRAVTVAITVPGEIPLEQAMIDIQGDIDQLRAAGLVPNTIDTQLAGSAAKLTEVRNSLLGEWRGLDFSPGSMLRSSMFLALLVTYLLLCALFESWTYPFVIMFAVPLATVGGFAALRIVHQFVPTQQLDVLTILGFIILIGIVVNNAILIVHQALNLMHGTAEVEVEGQIAHKLPPHQAIVESVMSRVRPIMMTTLTSLGGYLPLVLFPGAGSELYRGLGAVLMGGLLVSTIFTLLLVPLMLGVMLDLRKLVTGKSVTEDALESTPV
jgi:HAE1 family hydrophobic/amphiphilic exporter-1